MSKNLENQSIILQNTNENEPIQLKINSSTDYWALSFTILASVIVSMIAAYVTIKLVTNSNTKLIENQDIQNKNLIENQKDLQNKLIESQNQQLQSEVKSKNRQEWINRVRDLVAETITDINSFIITVGKEHIIRVQKYKELEKDSVDKGVISLGPPYPETVLIMRSFDKNVILLDLLLSKDDKIDRDIHSKLMEIGKLQSKILAVYGLAKDKNPHYDDIIIETRKIIKISNEISLLTKVLLKNEWNKVKSLE